MPRLTQLGMVSPLTSTRSTGSSVPSPPAMVRPMKNAETTEMAIIRRYGQR